MSLLVVKDLMKSYGGVHAVRGVSFTLEAGEALALIGPNGAGKSTCFNMLNGQTKPDVGSISFMGREIAGMSPRQIYRLGVGRTFQIAATFASMTVIENVQVSLLSHDNALWRMFGAVRRLRRDAAMHLLERVGLARQAGRACAELAYGDVKRLELAMALANNPKLLLMDEPTAGMAPQERGELMDLVANVARTERIGVLFTEHDMDIVFEHADRIMVLDRGRLIAEGDARSVRDNPAVRAVYLGEGLAFSAEATQ